MADNTSSWQRYQNYLIRYHNDPLHFTLDVSRMHFTEDWLASMAPACEVAYQDLAKLLAGEKVNRDEDRMVGHYWLRNADLAPADLRAGIQQNIAAAAQFAKDIHSGSLQPPQGGRFENLLLVGIGGSALGPQLLEDALKEKDCPLKTFFLDNTDPAGIHRTLDQLGPEGLAQTLCVVTSKSGGTPETRNGMLHAKQAFEMAGLHFAAHAVAITGVDSKLDQTARAANWLKRFPMEDWVGGRTSVMSTVGLIPAALQGIDIHAFLDGARAMDDHTAVAETRHNAAMMLALMWHWAGNGRGAKDMVILPYKDRLVLFSKYLQQLIMESLGKELDQNGARVEQGIAVYGNKGSTDQHAYVQQLRDGVNNFFATFLEVHEGGGTPLIVDETLHANSADYLQGFLRGTRSALTENQRESVTLSIPRVDPFHLGALIALFERAVTFYASLVNINAYHQPGVEAGKRVAGHLLQLMQQVRSHLEAQNGSAQTAEEVATALNSDPENVFHLLNHLSHQPESGITCVRAAHPAHDRFQKV